jgi:TPP-dependent pyruvate/acetoin dehydrogenase alpha subunit
VAGMSKVCIDASFPADVGPDLVRAAYERMLLIRTFEETVQQLFATEKMPGTVHLSTGQEAVAVGVGIQLEKEDYLTTTHRGHGHLIGKGCDPSRMMAEIFGKITGLCRGKGGSMHIMDPENGVLGANAIVGGGIPMTVGAALAARHFRSLRVAVAFFGDGAANQGTFHESLNLAAIWKLPVVFVCENNGFAEATSVRYHLSVEHVAQRAASYSIPGVLADGLDFFDVYEKVRPALARAREGLGPSLVECQTYRVHGHYEGDNQKYRTAEERARYRDCLESFRSRAVGAKLIDEREISALEELVNKRIADAVAFAKASTYPLPSDVHSDVYGDQA